jgi:hypothetical protein
MYFENEEDMEEKNNKSFSGEECTYEPFTGPMKINDSVTHLYEDLIADDLIVYRSNKMLEEFMYEIFLQSSFYNKYKNPKRIEKSDVNKMFYYFKDKILEKQIFSAYDIFRCFAEFFQINYELLYNEISISNQEDVLKDFDKIHQISHRFKSQRLF